MGHDFTIVYKLSETRVVVDALSILLNMTKAIGVLE
jgi:hypothetical protein